MANSGIHWIDITFDYCVRLLYQVAAAVNNKLDRAFENTACYHVNCFLRLVAFDDDEWRTREAVELQLAHKFGSNVEHAYHRTRLLTQRAELLKMWYGFLVR